MANVLITGATGNVGLAVVQALAQLTHAFTVYAGVREITKDQAMLAQYGAIARKFDFTDPSTYDPALAKCDLLFLLRPPQLSDVKAIFQPIIQAAKRHGVGHIVFLSVQGVQNSPIIPHHKIEKAIVASGIPYTFLRPAYFMQNFTTTLRSDLVEKQRIFLPAGNAKFTLVDVSDLGKVAAQVIVQPDRYRNLALDLTCAERLTFQEMAETLGRILEKPIRYESPNLVKFFWQKKREQVPTMLILVMIMLHYLPRFMAVPATTEWVEKITDNQATTFDQFVAKNKDLLR